MNRPSVVSSVSLGSEAESLFLFLLADVFADHFPEPAFSLFPELLVMRSLLADYESSATVTGIEPHGGGSGTSILAVESHPRPRLHKRTTGPELGGLFILHAHQGGALVILQHPYRTHRHIGPGRCLTHGVPVTRGERHHAHDDDRPQHNRYKDNEGFLQVWRRPG